MGISPFNNDSRCPKPPVYFVATSTYAGRVVKKATFLPPFPYSIPVLLFTSIALLLPFPLSSFMPAHYLIPCKKILAHFKSLYSL